MRSARAIAVFPFHLDCYFVACRALGSEIPASVEASDYGRDFTLHSTPRAAAWPLS